MGVRMANCGHDENRRYTGGKAGDQSGKEWYLRPWYSYPWNYILRWKDAGLGNLFADLAVEAAENDNVGYDQGQRYTFAEALMAAGWRPSKIRKPCEADCSSGVVALIRAVGHLKGIGDLQKCSATYTGNMMAWFQSSAGKKYFTVLTGKYLVDSSLARRGDINLNTAHHVNVTVDNGSNSGMSNAGAGTGAGTGTAPAGTGQNLIGSCTVTLKTFLVGAKDSQVRTIQILLKNLGFQGKNGKPLAADGILGENTAYAIEQFQRQQGMTGINYGTVGAKTWQLLLSAK